MEKHNHAVEFEDIAHLWRDLGFEDKSVVQVIITPVSVTVETVYVLSGEENIRVCDCTERDGGLPTVNHTFPLVYTDHKKKIEELEAAMAADAEAFENVELK